MKLNYKIIGLQMIYADHRIIRITVCCTLLTNISEICISKKYLIKIPYLKKLFHPNSQNLTEKVSFPVSFSSNPHKSLIGLNFYYFFFN